MENIFQSSLKKLEHYLIKEKYQGYDPYDILNSYIPFKYFGKWPAAIATQIHKRNPINIRPLLGIRKGINPKAFGLFLKAYSLLYKKTGNAEYFNKAEYFFNWLKRNYTEGYSGYCWGYNFPWANPEHYYDAYTPSSVVTGFVIKGIWEYYLITKDEQAKEIVLSASDFILNDIPVTQDDKGLCYSYTPLHKDLCFNASLLAAEILAISYNFVKNNEIKEKVIKAVDWVVAHQKSDGRWNYSIDLISRKQREQIDFHQGYVLESIFNIKEILGIRKESWDTALKRGLKFYIERQFTKEGWSYWRLPKKYPIEIHNQSQGIITFLRLAAYYKNAKKFAKTIAIWTIRNMQSKDGYFYYQKFNVYTNKISYMRWSNAWMFLALSYFVEETTN